MGLETIRRYGEILRRSSIVALLALFLAPHGRAASDLAAYFPSETGRTWRYTTEKNSTLTAGAKSRKSAKHGEVADKVRGPSEHGTVVIDRVVTEDNSTMGHVRIESSLRIRIEPDAIAVAALESPGQSVQRFSPEQPLLLRDLPGPEVEGLVGALRFKARLSSQSPSKTQAPAGVFSDCIITETAGSVSGTMNDAPVQDGSITIKAWYARGVGLVREERTLDFTVAMPNGERIQAHELATKLLEESKAP